MTTLDATTISRSDHLHWCRVRALQYADAGDARQAFASMASDLGKHPETAGHPAIRLGFMMLAGGFLGTPGRMREFIEGFNRATDRSDE